MTTITPLGSLPTFPKSWLQLKPDLQAFLGFLPDYEQWSISLSGDKGSGKSSLALIIADQLAQHGNVLYVTNEEHPKSGALGERAQRVNVIVRDKIHVLETRNSTEMWSLLQKPSIYKFCVIDSLNEFFDDNRRPIPAKRITDDRDLYPHVNFIESKKNLGFAGGNNLGIKATTGKY